MSRDLTSAVQTAVAAASVPLIAFVELLYDSGTARYCTAPSNVSWSGHTWYGVGELGSIEQIGEVGGVEAKSIRLELSGIDTANISLALGEDYQNRACNIYAAPLDSDHIVLADPKLLFAGLIDTMEIQVGATARIAVTVTSRLADLERPRVRRYNRADQRAEYPNDAFFDFVESVIEANIQWGGPGPSTVPAPAGWFGAVQSAFLKAKG